MVAARTPIASPEMAPVPLLIRSTALLVLIATPLAAAAEI